MSKPRRPQPLIVRIAHWIDVPVLAVMAASGLQILRASPFFGPKARPTAGCRCKGWDAPAWLRAGQWLAGARQVHFALAWLLVVNAIVYLAYLACSGEWRRRWFWPPRDTLPAIRQLLYYLRLRKTAPPVDLYNSLQRSAYTFAISVGIVEMLSGFAIYKPVQLHRLAWLMGGYEGARTIHFLGLVALIAFTLAHVVMVALHPRSLVEMITGGKRDQA